ncbi:MAG: response regulator transcription factor [Bacteroidota bacterium]
MTKKTDKTMIQVALVDDHAVTRKGIKTIIELNPAIKVTLEASDGEEFLRLLSKQQAIPDVVMLDLTMPRLNGMDTIVRLKESYPSIYILVFSLISEEDSIINMITKGACGYIHKGADPAILSNAIIEVYNKGFYLGHLVKKEYFKQNSITEKKPGFNGKHFLTERELQFIRLSASNLNYKEIADIMEIKPKTLENYRDSLFQKLSINNRAALTLYGLKNGIVNL